MANRPLEHIAVDLYDPVFNAISDWPFAEEFVSRILIEDIPQRMAYEAAKMWAYLDAQKSIVGFGTLTMSADCRQFTDDRPHMYIPLLAVHPEARGLGYGKSIVAHLVEESANVFARNENGLLHEAVFLDVYEDSFAAIRLYQNCNFITLNGAMVDPINGKNFYVMAKRISR